MLPGAKKRVMQRKEPAKRLTLEQKLDLINHAKNGVKNVELCKITLKTKGEKKSADTEESQAYYLGLSERVMQRKEPAKRLTLEQKLELINHAKNGVKNDELSWSDVSAETLRNAWGKLIDRDMPRNNSCQDSTLEACDLLNNLPKSKEISVEDTNERLQADSTEDTWRRLTDEEIIAAAQGYTIQDDSDNAGNNNNDVAKKRSKEGLIRAALILNDWIKYDPESDVEECKMLLKLKQ
ncbi:hypothetical protein NQ318_008162, partial [Aromia moschata]